MASEDLAVYGRSGHVWEFIGSLPAQVPVTTLLLLVSYSPVHWRVKHCGCSLAKNPVSLSFSSARSTLGESDWAMKGDELVHFSSCGVGRVKVYLLTCIGALLKEGGLKVAWV